MKTDQSIHNICIAAIERSTLKPYNFQWTKFYENNAAFKLAYPALDIILSKHKCVICSTVMDGDNFSILTTQKIITNENGTLSYGNIAGATSKSYGFFKRTPDNTPFTWGVVQWHDGSTLRYLVETGAASMVMIKGVGTILQIGS